MKTFNKANNKKLVAGIITLFSAAAVVSTGFASWVISAGDTKEATGTVQVDTVENKAHTITVGDWSPSNKVIFGAPASPTATTYSWLSNDSAAADKESLSLSLTVTVSNCTSATAVNTVIDSVTLTADAGYASCVTAGYVAALPTPSYGSFTDAGVLTITLSFEWGSAFGGENPYYYYNAQAYTSTLGTDANTKLGDLKTKMADVGYKLTIVTK